MSMYYQSTRINQNLANQKVTLDCDLCPNAPSFPSQGELPKLELMLPTVKVTWGCCSGTRIRCLKSKGALGPLHFQGVPFLCTSI